MILRRRDFVRLMAVAGAVALAGAAPTLMVDETRFNAIYLVRGLDTLTITFPDGSALEYAPTGSGVVEVIGVRVAVDGTGTMADRCRVLLGEDGPVPSWA